jgi:hypothetical protein
MDMTFFIAVDNITNHHFGHALYGSALDAAALQAGGNSPQNQTRKHSAKDGWQDWEGNHSVDFETFWSMAFLAPVLYRDHVNFSFNICLF